MTNQLREARYYKLLFKNNLQLIELRGKVDIMGDDKDMRNFERELRGDKETKELIDEKINDEIFDDLALDALETSGLTEDEAENELEEYNN